MANKLLNVDETKHNEWRILMVNDIMKNCNYSKYTTVEEQKELQIKYSNLPDAPPRSEWMTVDECFDDVIYSVEEIYDNKEFDLS